VPSEAEWEKAARGGVEIPVAAQYATVGQGLARAEPERRKNPQPQRAWPWGDEWDSNRANTEGTVGVSSTPGCFEAGRSPTGCLDMAGNVWEWTRSLWGTEWQRPDFVYPYDARDLKREDLDASNDVMRVVRGGSSGDRRGGARCAFRLGLHPVLRLVSLGFRVVLRSSPVP
jgi:formylglycine-generating enzyme required for sulfatase activity